MDSTAEGKFNINIASIDVAKNLVAEIYYNSFAIATIHSENIEFEIQFFSDPRINAGIDSISVNLHQFIETVEKAKLLLKTPPDFLYNSEKHS